MKKLLILIVLLAAFATSAYAIELNQLEIRDKAWIQGKDELFTIEKRVFTFSPRNHEEIPFDAIKNTSVSYKGIPFQLTGDPYLTYGTGKAEIEAFDIDINKNCSEIYLLLYSDFPEQEWFAVWGYAQGLKLLNVPERMSVKVKYSDNTVDEYIPYNLEISNYGITHKTGAYVIKTDISKQISKVSVVDRMSNASFIVLGTTINTGKEITILPEQNNIYYKLAKAPDISKINLEFAAKDGLSWGKIESAMLKSDIDLSKSPVFDLIINGTHYDSTKWQVTNVEKSGENTKYYLSNSQISLTAILTSKQIAANKVKLDLAISNNASNNTTGTLLFPVINSLVLGDNKNTWYCFNRDGAVINNIDIKLRDFLSCNHPIQFDSVFNPNWGAGLMIATQDTTELFRYYNFNKNENGINYSMEYLPQTIKSGDAFNCVSSYISIIPGDWKSQMQDYLKWVKTWYKPMPRNKFFQDIFACGVGGPVKDFSFLDQAKRVINAYGYCDYYHCSQHWAISPIYGNWGDYDHFENVGGKDKFNKDLNDLIKAGIPRGIYLDGYLLDRKTNAYKNQPATDWQVWDKDNNPLIAYGDAAVMCLYSKGWRDYLVGRYKFIQDTLNLDALYIDELGEGLPSRTCYNPKHGHPVPTSQTAGETMLFKQLKETLKPTTATYTEMGATDVQTQYIDGSFSYLVPRGYDAPYWAPKHETYETIAPHYINLMRFAFPDFKYIHLINEIAMKNGNWFNAKYPFFNGDAYYTHAPLSEYSDKASKDFYRKVFAINHKYIDAFTSRDVEPLINTNQPNVFVNKFSAPKYIVYTVLNANYQTARGELLRVNYKKGAKFIDVWNNKPVKFRVEGNTAILSIEIAPKSVGCVVQKWSK